MASVEIRLLGGFEAKLTGGASIELPIRKAELLLACLAFSPGRPKPREKLMALLWSGRDDSQARGSLRHALSALRKGFSEIEPSPLLSDRASVDLDPGALDVDVLHFEALAVEATPGALDEAAALYRGDLLDGIPVRDPEFEDWLAAERARLRDVALGVFARLLDHQAGHATPDRAVATARRLLDLDPLREASHRALMTLFAASGERAAALQQFETCRALLERELGIAPDPETEALCETIRAGDAPASSAGSLPPAYPASPPEPSAPAAPAETAEPAETLSVAVLPFRNLTGDTGEEHYVDGFTEEVMNRLSRFRQLDVSPSRSAFAYKDRAQTVPEIAQELGVRYVVEGTVRLEDDRLRVTAQFVDAVDDRQVWAENFDHAAAERFVARDTIAGRIAASLGAIKGGVVSRTALGRSRRKAEENRTIDDLYVLGTEHQMRYTKADIEISRALFDKALMLDPSAEKVLIGQAWNDVIEWRSGWTEDREGANARALMLADKAAALDPSDPEVIWLRGAIALFVGGDFDSAARHYREAMRLNPNAAEILAHWGLALGYGGRAEEGIAAAQEAIALNPLHPLRFYWALGIPAYVAQRYDDAIDALEHAVSGGKTGPIAQYYLAASYAQAGRLDEARSLAGALRAERAEWTAERLSDREPFKFDADREHVLEGLRKAGLGEVEGPTLSPGPPARPSVVVLPFANLSADTEHDYFVDGMTEDITTELARFRTLTVIASQSAMTYKGRAVDPRDVADELGIAYVVQGSVRRSGERIRIAAQLVDALSGEQLWNQRYDRKLEDVFAIQDEAVQTIVSTLTSHLRLAEEKRAKRKHPASLQAYDYVLQAGDPFVCKNARETATVRGLCEKALDLDPEYVEAAVGIAGSHIHDHEFCWTPPEAKSLEKAFDWARRAVELDQNNASAHHALGYAYLHAHDYDRAEVHYERSVAFNPSDVSVAGDICFLHAMRGRVDDVIDVCDRGRRQNPMAPDWYAWNLACAHYMAGRFTEALAAFDQIAEWQAEVYDFAAACHAQLGNDAEARRLMAEFHRRVKPIVAVYPGTDREAWRRYYATGYPFEYEENLEHLLEGLEKAGLYDLA